MKPKRHAATDIVVQVDKAGANILKSASGISEDYIRDRSVPGS